MAQASLGLAVLGSISFYHPRMQIDNYFSRVCLSVQATTFKQLELELHFEYSDTYSLYFRYL